MSVRFKKSSLVSCLRNGDKIKSGNENQRNFKVKGRMPAATNAAGACVRRSLLPMEFDESNVDHIPIVLSVLIKHFTSLSIYLCIQKLQKLFICSTFENNIAVT